MAKATQSQRAQPQPVLPQPESQYRELLTQLGIVSINLIEIQARAEVPQIEPDQTSVQSEYNINSGFLNEAKTAFHATSRLTVGFQETTSDQTLGKITVEFVVQYTSQHPSTDEFLQRFAQENVPLNAWPYLRELIHNTMLRFGWAPLVLPLYFVMTQENTETNEPPNKSPSKKPKILEQPK